VGEDIGVALGPAGQLPDTGAPASRRRWRCCCWGWQSKESDDEHSGSSSSTHTWWRWCRSWYHPCPDRQWTRLAPGALHGLAETGPDFRSAREAEAASRSSRLHPAGQPET
jgi:hypothetical protein